MNWGKIESFLNSKLGICILTGVLMFGAGKTVGLKCSSTEEENFNSCSKSIVQSQKIIAEQKDKISELQAKVDEAEPYLKRNDEEKANTIEVKSKTLTSGNYESGKDFEPGIYDIIAVSGGGNVYSSNSYEGGINTILGSDEKIAKAASVGMGDMYKKEYKNVNLPKGTMLKIDGVEVKLSAKS